MYNNICLIGMPYSGKSVIGNRLFKYLKKGYIDTNSLIQQKYNLPIHEIIKKYGETGYLNIESDIVQSLRVQNTVISTGGSIIYNHDTMKHIQTNITPDIYHLFISKKTLLNRIDKNNHLTNDIIMNSKNSINELYNERIKLYDKYSFKTIQAYNLNNVNLDLFRGETYYKL